MQIGLNVKLYFLSANNSTVYLGYELGHELGHELGREF